MPYTRKTKSKNKRRTMKGGVRPRRSSPRSPFSTPPQIQGSPRSPFSTPPQIQGSPIFPFRNLSSSSSSPSSSVFSFSRSSSSSSPHSVLSSRSGSPVHSWTDLKKVLENSNPLINLNLYHGNQLRNLLNDALQIAKTLTKKEKELIKNWVKIEKKKPPPVRSDGQITIWKNFLHNFTNQIK